jgi:REP element-mobilizing transposase RayT
MYHEAAMSYNDLRKGRYSEPGREYFVTTVLQGRPSLFTDLYLARTVIGVLRETQTAGLGIWLAWVVMPDHFHGLVSLTSKGNLSALMQRFKGASAREINRRLGHHGTCWQPAFYDHALRTGEDRIGVARYIVANPLRAGLVERLGDYPHWDSVWLMSD